VNRIGRLILALGAIFVAAVAVAGCGSAIPGDSVAVVAGNPITRATLAHWGYIAAVGSSEQSPGSPVIVPDPPVYTKCIASLRKVAPASIPESELKSACQQQFAQTMEYLIRADWIQGQAAAKGLKATNAEVQKAFNTAKGQQFKTDAQFQAFLKQTGQTLNDILYRFRITVLAQKLATPAAIKAYYNSHLAQYSTPERRNVRIILAKTLAQANAAKAALASHHTWLATAKKYSTDTATKNTGGLLTGLINGEEPSALNKVIFSAPHGVLEGPIKTPFGYYVTEVTDIFPATRESLKQATATIKAALAQAALSSPTWLKHWKAMTTCRDGFQIPDCNNYKAPKPVTTTPTTAGGTATTPTTAGGPATTTTSTTKKK
jgi:parvulin-like peptidyl-prolyl isomerase